MERTTRKQLENLLRQLAAVTNAPLGPVWTKRPDGTNQSTVGCLELDHAPLYGGYVVEQICNESGAVTRPFGDMRVSAAAMWNALRYAIAAVRLAIGEDEFHQRMRRAFPA